jgi:transposase InsO family protein
VLLTQSSPETIVGDRGKKKCTLKGKDVIAMAVESYIYFYNYKRIHSAIGYLISVQKMAELGKVA